jgi:hypothetical protein
MVSNLGPEIDCPESDLSWYYLDPRGIFSKQPHRSLLSKFIVSKSLMIRRIHTLYIYICVCVCVCYYVNFLSLFYIVGSYRRTGKVAFSNRFNTYKFLVLSGYHLVLKDASILRAEYIPKFRTMPTINSYYLPKMNELFKECD